MAIQTLVDLKYLKDFDTKEAINTLAYIVQGGAMSNTTYSRSVPLTGATVTASAGEYRRILEPAGTLATLNLVLPSSPLDGDIYEIMSTQTITVLSVTAGAKTVRGNIFTLNEDSGASWIYRSANTTWYVRN
jgi:hypothetical protein